jgi:hypothetical protein
MHPVTECLIWHKIPFVICEEILTSKRKEKILNKQIIPECEINCKKVYYKIYNRILWQRGFYINETNTFNISSFCNFQLSFSFNRNIKDGDFIPFLNKWSGINFIEYDKSIFNETFKRKSKNNQMSIQLIDIEWNIIDINSFKSMVLK